MGIRLIKAEKSPKNNDTDLSMNLKTGVDRK